MTFSEWWSERESSTVPTDWPPFDKEHSKEVWNAATEEAAKICDAYGEKITAAEIRLSKEADRGTE